MCPARILIILSTKYTILSTNYILYISTVCRAV